MVNPRSPDIVALFTGETLSTLSQVHLKLRRVGVTDPDGNVHAFCAILDLALVEVVGGNTDEAMRLVRSWRRKASTDLAELIDPFYPHYDSIRDEPEFVE